MAQYEELGLLEQTVFMIVFGIGGVTSILLSRWKGARFAEDMGIPIAGGLIVGDALLEIANAIVEVSKAL